MVGGVAEGAATSLTLAAASTILARVNIRLRATGENDPGLSAPARK